MSNKIEYVKDSFEEYLGKLDHVSSSDIKNFLKSPQYYLSKRGKLESEDADDDEDTSKGEFVQPKSHFAVGSAAHELIMEPHYFDEHYFVIPKLDKRTKQGKADYELYVHHAGNRVIINQEQMDMMKQMALNAQKNHTMVDLMSDCMFEVSCYGIDEKTGLGIRVRPDILPNKKSTIVDIKTCRSSSPKNFRNDVFKFDYSISSAFYSDLLGRENYVFAAFEKQAPYQLSLFALDDDKVEYGRSQYRMALDLLRWSIDNDYWCNYVEFEILKEAYLLGNLNGFKETLKESELIQII